MNKLLSDLLALVYAIAVGAGTLFFLGAVFYIASTAFRAIF